MSEGLGSVATVLIDRSCVSCRRTGSMLLCDRCLRSLRAAPPVPLPAGVDTFDALVRYEGAGRDLVLALKYRNTRPALGPLARAMADLTARHRPSAVTWAPTTPDRRRERGYDQAQLLARAVARRLRVPCVRLLDRPAGPAQTGRDRAERLEGPRIVARRTHHGSVLLIDDVCTTGATLGAAASALRSQGSAPIHACTLAVTPAAPTVRSLKAATVTAEDGMGGPVDPHEKRNFDATD
jgi:predicted amidophosphoribosyltransferase